MNVRRCAEVASREPVCDVLQMATNQLDHLERLNPKVNAIVSLQPREGLMKQEPIVTLNWHAATTSVGCTAFLMQ